MEVGGGGRTQRTEGEGDKRMNSSSRETEQSRKEQERASLLPCITRKRRSLTELGSLSGWSDLTCRHQHV